MKTILLISFLILNVCTCVAESLTGKVVRVSDGDTFTLLVKGNRQVKVRMYGIDAPEMKGNQPYCRKAKDFLAELIAGKTVKVEVQSTDRYGRKVGITRLADGTDVNRQMIKNGLAWHYSYYDNSADYAKAEKEARAAKRGLWKDKNPVNPYQWRKNNK